MNRWVEVWCQFWYMQWELNPQLADCDSAALPLSNACGHHGVLTHPKWLFAAEAWTRFGLWLINNGLLFQLSYVAGRR